MDEIDKRFELIRLAAQLGDYEVIDTQIKRLQNMSTDRNLHDILRELEAKNFRQALHMMQDYAATLQDDFFNPPSAAPRQPSMPKAATTRPPSPAQTQTNASVNAPSRQPAQHEGSHFAEHGSGSRTLGLEEMLQMTKAHASGPRHYASSEADTAPKQESAVEPLVEKEAHPSKSDIEPLGQSPEDYTRFQRKPSKEEASELTHDAAVESAASHEPVSTTGEMLSSIPEPTENPEELDPLFTLDQEVPLATQAPTPSEPEMIPASTVREEPPVLEENFTQEATTLFDAKEDPADFMMDFSPAMEQKPSIETSVPSEAPVSLRDEPAVVPETSLFSLDEPDVFFQSNEDHPFPKASVPTDPKPVETLDPVPTIQAEETLQMRSSAEDALRTTVPPRETLHDFEPEPEPTFEPVPEPTPASKETDDILSGTQEETPEVVSRQPWDLVPNEFDTVYENFPYTGQKFRNMMHQYAQRVELEEGVIPEVQAFIDYVSKEDYSEAQVEAVIARYQELKEQSKLGEAAQMLIAAATTESIFAQFMLARELFKGDVLQQNYPESFTQINRLAEEDYPEAICDLGQLYEYGIGIDKNKNHALLLYEEAAQMGVKRAQKHYERLKGSNPLESIKSLTSSLFGRKQ